MSASICERSRGVSSIALKAVPSFFTPVDPAPPDHGLSVSEGTGFVKIVPL